MSVKQKSRRIVIRKVSTGWHAWLMDSQGSYSIRKFGSFRTVVLAFENGFMREWWDHCWGPISTKELAEVLREIDSTE